MRRLRPILLMFALVTALLALRAGAGAVTLYVDSDGSAVYRPMDISPARLVCAGEALESDIPPYITSGRTMVPVRLIAETLGAQVEWLGDTRQVRITGGGHVVLLTIGSAEAAVDGEVAELYDGIPAVIAYDGTTKRTMVPLRFVAEMLGAGAEFDRETRSVVITPAGSETARVLSVSAEGGAVTICYEGECTPAVFSLSDPERVVVDFPGGVLDPSIPYRTGVGSAAVSAVRANQYDHGYEGFSRVARVVLDLAGGVTFSGLAVDLTQPGAVTITPTVQPEPEPEPDAPAGPLVVLDAGHGGSDPGTQAEGLDEKDLNLAVERRVAELLTAAGVRVERTRTADVYVTLADRAQLANDLGADLFVSIHTNASASSAEFHGIETYYLAGRQDSRALAACLHRSVLSATGAHDNLLRTAGFYVLRHTDMPAALVEMGYVTNEAELQNLKSDEYREKLAQGIADGIVACLMENGLL